MASQADLGPVIGGSKAASAGRRLMERLPGMAPKPFASCRVLEGCAEAPLAFHIEKGEHVPETVAALVRPWVLLQKARGKELIFNFAPGAGDRLMNMNLEGLPQASFAVHISAPLTGGCEVSLRGRPDPSRLFDEQRRAVLENSLQP